MSKHSILCFVVLFGTFSVLYAGWSADVRLTNNRCNSHTSLNNAWCVATISDYVYVVWYDNRDDNFEIYYKYKSSDADWSSDIRLTNNAGGSKAPCVALSGTNRHVVWNDDRDGNEEIYYNRLQPFVTEDKRLTNDSCISRAQSLAASGSNLHVVWCDWRTPICAIYYKRSTNSGIKWSNDMRISANDSLDASSIPSIAVLDSIVHVVWMDSRNGYCFEIYYDRSLDNGTTWGNDIRLTSNDSASSVLPCIAVSGTNIHVVWQDMRDGNNEIYYIRSMNNGVSWGNETRLTSNDSSSTRPSIAVSDSNVHVVWKDTRDGNYEIYYICSTNNGTSWGNETRLTSNDSSSTNPSIAVSGENLHVVWTDMRDGNKEIYYKTYTPDEQSRKLKNSKQIELYSCRAYATPSGIKLEGNVPVISPLHISLFDVAGREVSTIIHHPVSTDFRFVWELDNLPSGVYFVSASQKQMFQVNSHVVWLK